MGLPHLSETPGAVVYGPLAESRGEPDVVLLRINGFALMTLKGAFPEMPIEGKPQCHIVAMAKDQGTVAASVGCALSRSRTGMRSEEMTCVIPGRRLEEAVEKLERPSRSIVRWRDTPRRMRSASHRAQAPHPRPSGS